MSEYSNAERDKIATDLLERDEALEMLAQLEFILPYGGGRCPVCLGWEVIKGQGECSRVHTPDCKLKAILEASEARSAKGGKQALAAEALIEHIEHMNSAEGSHLAFMCLNRRSYESRLVVRALKKLQQP